MLKFTLRLAALLALVICFVWVIREPKFDSFAALAAAVVVVLGTFLTTREKSPNQTQTAFSGSTAIQAGRDVNVGRDAGNGPQK